MWKSTLYMLQYCETSTKKLPRANVAHGVNAGNRSTKLLVGIQVQPHQEEAFAVAQEQLAADFTFEELSGKARQVFMMFIS